MTEIVGQANIKLSVDLSEYTIAIERAKAQQAGLGTAASTEADKMTVAQKRVTQSLSQQIDKLGLTREQTLAYNVVMRTSGAVQEELLTKIKANTVGIQQQGNAAAKTAVQFNQYGISQKQQAAALRQVPAQITDIFVSLQGGQNPLTVLLQQGGQLKDIFGGVMPALRGLTTGLLGLVNPFTLVAAAVGVVGAAYLSGEARINAFNQAIILTGQQGKISATELQGMASSLDSLAGVTARQGADVLTQLVATGRIAADQLTLVGSAVATTADATGAAVKDIIAGYVEIARDPVNAVLKLNESEGWLTQTLYQRIKAMQDAGDIEGAAALATEARALVQLERNAEIVDSLGLVSGAWYSIKQSTGEAWDEATNYFSNLDREAKQATSTLASLWNSFKVGGPAGMFGMSAAMSPSTGPIGPASTRGAPAAKVNSQAQTQLEAIINGNKTRLEQQELEEKRIRNLAKATNLQTKETEELVKASRKAYEESLPKGPKGKSGAGAARSLANAESRAELQEIKDALAEEQNAIQNSGKLLQAEYAARLVTAGEYYSRQRVLVEDGVKSEEAALVKQIAVLRDRNVAGKDSVDVTRQIGQLETQLAKIRADSGTQLAILSIQEQDAMEKRRRASEDYKYALDREVEAISKGFDAQIASITMSDKEAEKQARLTAIYEAQTEALRKLQRQRDEGSIDQGEYEKRVRQEEDAADRSARAVEDGYERMADAQANWLNGLRTGIENWIDGTKDVASQVERITTMALDRATDALVEFAVTGKFQWKQMLADILKEIVKFFAKRAVMQFLQYIISAWGSGGAGAGTATAGASGGGGGFVGPQALGNAFPNTGNLSEYSGTVVNEPTPFYFAKGAGVMGEAGHEGIFPLERGTDGKLGVKAMGFGGSTEVNLNMGIQFNSNGGDQKGTEGERGAAFKQLGENMRNIAKDEMQRATMPGGYLWKVGVSAG